MRRHRRSWLRSLPALALLVMPTAASAAPDLPPPPVPAAAAAAAVAPAALGTAVAPTVLATDAELQFAELPNLHRVDEHVFRGGQPAKDGYSRLKALGVRTVLNLRYESGERRDEEAAAKAAGLEYVSIPMYPLLPPTAAQMKRVVALLTDPARGPVFVHCQQGVDRTGVVIACYRIAHAGWTAKRAIEEAMVVGMNPLELLKREFVRSFARTLASQAPIVAQGALAAVAPPAPAG